MYEGRTTEKPGKVFGHEPLGVVEKVGDGVVSLREGDRVVVTFNVACGYCFNCVRGFTSACLTTNPVQPGGAFGYAGMGPYAGAQAELLRVPSPTSTAQSSREAPETSGRTTSCFSQISSPQDFTPTSWP